MLLLELNKCEFTGKFDEKDMMVPRTSELNKFVDNEYKLSDFILMELMLLEFFKWDLMVPTAAHFTEFFSTQALSHTDLHYGRPLRSSHKAHLYVKQYVAYFLDVSLQGTYLSHSFRLLIIPLIVFIGLGATFCQCEILRQLKMNISIITMIVCF